MVVEKHSSFTPCQQALVASRYDTVGSYGIELRIYRCGIADHWCVISGIGPDEEIMFPIFCDGCEKAASLE